MSVRIRIKGREFTLSWSEFQKVLDRHTVSEVIDILDIREGSHANA